MSTSTTTDDEREALVRRELDAVWNDGRLDAATDLCHPDVVVHDPAAPDGRRGLDGYRTFVSRARTNLDGHALAIDDLAVAGDRVVARLSTDDGGVSGLHVLRVADGAVAERWGTLLDADAVESFAGGLRGDVVRPTDDEYDEARSVWNGMIDRYPAIVARCAGVADVVDAVAFAAAHDLLVAVRGGGHNVAGHAVCDGGIVVDLSGMRSVRVDPDAKTARVEPGATWADLDRETQAFGLAVPGGLVSSTGVAGLTLGGGFGWLSRKFGMTCDSLLSADVVTADGEFLTASAEEHPELFWGLRGGGGNFGVVTSFEFRLHEVGPEVLAGPVFHRFEDAPDVLANYREVVADAPDDLSAYLLFRRAPPAPFLPEDVHGEPIFAVVICYVGDLDAGEEATAPLREHGDPLADAVQPRPYTEWQQFSDANWEAGFRDYWKADYLAGLDDACIDTFVEYAGTIPTPLTDFKIGHFEGAIRDVPADATAFPHRDAPFVINVNTRWEDPAADDEHVAWTREFFEAMQPHSTGRTYVNFLGEEGRDRVEAAYGEETFDRLAALKAEYDPGNRFRRNQNVRPAE